MIHLVVHPTELFRSMLDNFDSFHYRFPPPHPTPFHHRLSCWICRRTPRSPALVRSIWPVIWLIPMEHLDWSSSKRETMTRHDDGGALRRRPTQHTSAQRSPDRNSIWWCPTRNRFRSLPAMSDWLEALNIYQRLKPTKRGNKCAMRPQLTFSSCTFRQCFVASVHTRFTSTSFLLVCASFSCMLSIRLRLLVSL